MIGRYETEKHYFERLKKREQKNKKAKKQKSQCEQNTNPRSR